LLEKVDCLLHVQIGIGGQRLLVELDYLLDGFGVFGISRRPPSDRRAENGEEHDMPIPFLKSRSSLGSAPATASSLFVERREEPKL